jgi:branched-chain amino acid transport system substrate-binding protein
MKTRVKQLALGLLVLLFLTSCNSVNQDKEVIKIGVIAPLTGAAESFGKSMQNGILLLKDSVNSNGGILGHSIDFIFEDDKLSAKDGVNAFNKLVNIDKTQAIIGSAASGISLALLPLANTNKIVMISSISTADDLKGDEGDYFFRVVPPNYKQGQTAVKFIIEDLNFEKIALVYANDDYGLSFAESIEQNLQNAKVSLVYKNAYNPGITDFKNILTQIKKTSPEVVIIAGIIPETAIIQRQAKEINLNCVFISGDGSYSPDLFKLGGSAVDGSYYTTMTLPEDTVTSFASFVRAYNSKYDEKPDMWAAYSFDAALTLISAIKEAEQYEGTKIKEALYKADIPGVTGRITFDVFGEIEREYSIFEAKEGEFTLLKK